MTVWHGTVHAMRIKACVVGINGKATRKDAVGQYADAQPCCDEQALVVTSQPLLVWCAMMWCGVVWCGSVRCGVVLQRTCPHYPIAEGVVDVSMPFNDPWR
jgi:hypothetical protein